MGRIVLDSVNYFELSKGQKFSYHYTGSKIHHTTLKIYDSSDGSLVKTSYDYEHGLYFYHELEGYSGLMTGVEYYAVIYLTYQTTTGSTVDEPSPSNAVYFRCLTEPYIVFDSIPSPITSSSYDLAMTYVQIDDEPLLNYTIKLCVDSTEVYNSGLINVENGSPSYDFVHSMYNLPEGNFVLLFEGETVHGDIFTSNYSINVSYSQPRSTCLITARNREKNRDVEIETHLNIISGVLRYGETPIYIDGTKIDLSNDMLVYNNVNIDQDFTLQLEVSGLKSNSSFLSLSSGNGRELRVYTFYEKIRKDNSEPESTKYLYLNLYVTDNNLVYADGRTNEYYTLSACSNFVIPVSTSDSTDGKVINDILIVNIRCISGRYDIAISDKSIT